MSGSDTVQELKPRMEGQLFSSGGILFPHYRVYSVSVCMFLWRSEGSLGCLSSGAITLFNFKNSEDFSMFNCVGVCACNT